MVAKVELARMSWKEAECAARENRPVLIPVGCLEQHGPHLPLGSDSIVAEYFAIQVAKGSGAVVMPVISYGWSPFFREFVGSISIRPSTLEVLLTDLVEGLLEQGFRHIVFICNHASNEPMCEHVARDIEHRHGVILGSMFPWRLMQQLTAELYEDTPGAFGHGGEPETSVMLELCPTDVDITEAVQDTLKPFDKFQMTAWSKAKVGSFWAGLYVNGRQISDTGVTGNPIGASPEKGHATLEKSIAWGVEFVKDFARLNVRRPQH